MEHISPKMAAAFGVGFVGFIFAAYSYNQQHKNDFINYTSDDSLDISNNNIENNESLEEKNEIKKEVETFLENSKQKPNWSKFWKGEYKEMRNKNIEK